MPRTVDPSRATGQTLGDACVAEALLIIGEQGLGALSIREVARRLGVSHQAPYRHYPSRDHLVAEVIGRAFGDFAGHLDARPRSGDPEADLRNMGVAYLDYAWQQPLRYHLMFSAPQPDPAAHPEMMRRARHAFQLLCIALARLPQHAASGPAAIDAAAVYVWSTLHGLASLRSSNAFALLQIDPSVRSGLPETVLGHMRPGSRM